MIISHKYKFIFIKTGKTAGTSIEVFLSKFCDKNDILTPIYPAIEGHIPRNYSTCQNPISKTVSRDQTIQKTTYDLENQNKFYNHIPAKIIKKKVSAHVWENYYKICVERNPWDKTLSHYYMMNYRSNNQLTLDKYLEKTNKFCYNEQMYCDNNEIIIDKVIKYENLRNELFDFFNKIGIPFDGNLEMNAKSEYRKDRRHYSNIFTNKQKDIIEEAFQNEIKMHNYKY